MNRIYTAGIALLVALAPLNASEPLSPEEIRALDDLDKGPGRVMEVLRAIQTAARDRNQNGLLDHLHPVLRRTLEDHEIRLEDGTVFREVMESTPLETVELGSLAVIGDSGSVRALHIYHQPDGEIWEAVICLDRPEPSAELWYFVKVGGRLLVRDAPHFPPTALKHFEVEPGSAEQRRKAAQPGATDNPGNAQ